MSHYYKTAQGHTALANRQLNLNVRQRRLLLLIGTEDFNQLSDQLREKIASPELLQQLEQMGLIQFNTAPTSSSSRTNKSNNQPSEMPDATGSDVICDEIALMTQINSNQKYQIDTESTQKLQTDMQTLSVMAFDEVKTLMADTLASHCGLLARQLLEQIKNASNIKQLKICQMQWITHLQETRIPPQQLNQQLQQVNFALQHLKLNQ